MAIPVAAPRGAAGQNPAYRPSGEYLERTKIEHLSQRIYRLRPADYMLWSVVAGAEDLETQNITVATLDDP
jgi:hypothetical protein